MLPANELHNLSYPQTPATARAWFERHGICQGRWAHAHGFDRMTVVDLLRGKRFGLRGEAHRAAIALGLKADPEPMASACARTPSAA